MSARACLFWGASGCAVAGLAVGLGFNSLLVGVLSAVGGFALTTAMLAAIRLIVKQELGRR